ncbi:FxLYD domain-containing protein [Bifidobacterium sp. CP2]|uniref:FxLYD domain-containing protein n=1 Tax=Bifidobacterium sp. CP2 TaxID=2809025 RepID=UPI001F0AF277|nr:FxLYD domain-containing protein [Bifidobacterium sp. CP2]
MNTLASRIRACGRTVAVATVCLAMTIGLAACSSSAQTKDEGPDYADDEAMSIIAEGFQKRSDVIEQYEQKNEDDSSEYVKAAVQAEIDTDKGLKSRQFKDSKLQENVIAYLNLLDDSMDVVKNNSYMSADYTEQWTKVYDKRSALLKTFVDDYGLKVDEKYQESLNDIVANGSSVQKKTETEDALNNLISSTTFEKTDDGYGMYTYSAVIENTTGIDFGSVTLLVALYGADGVKVEETYASTSSWPKGEKVKFEAMSTNDAAQVKVSVSDYEVED